MEQDNNISIDKINEVLSEIIDNNDSLIANTIVEIVKKIMELPYESETTIAKLIDYNPNENMIDPLTQGKIMNYVEQVCAKLGIKIQSTSDSFGGLAYNYAFKKIN